MPETMAHFGMPVAEEMKPAVGVAVREEDLATTGTGHQSSTAEKLRQQQSSQKQHMRKAEHQGTPTTAGLLESVEMTSL
jgi:hypothetical protein